MKNNHANYIAQSMKTLLDSPEYQAIFKTASSMKDKEEDKDKKDESKADDLDLDSELDFEDDSEDLGDDLDLDMSYAKDKKKDKKDEDDCGMSDDKKDLDEVVANYDIAIDGLLTASAALDELGSPTGSAATIKLANLIVQAKKKKVEDEKAKAKSKKDKEKDKNMAKGKLPPGLKKHMDKNKDGKLTKKEKEEAAQKARKGKK